MSLALVYHSDANSVHAHTHVRVYVWVFFFVCVCVTNNRSSAISFDTLLSGCLPFFAAISIVLSLPLASVTEN